MCCLTGIGAAKGIAEGGLRPPLIDALAAQFQCVRQQHGLHSTMRTVWPRAVLGFVLTACLQSGPRQAVSASSAAFLAPVRPYVGCYALAFGPWQPLDGSLAPRLASDQPDFLPPAVVSLDTVSRDGRIRITPLRGSGRARRSGPAPHGRSGAPRAHAGPTECGRPHRDARPAAGTVRPRARPVLPRSPDPRQRRPSSPPAFAEVGRQRYGCAATPRASRARPQLPPERSAD